ncbi:AAA-ATPase [Microbacterium phage Rasputia]|nr:AAA-ATPase [Microbacterium phage Rasputia]
MLMVGSFGGVELSNLDEMAADYGRWLIHGPQGSGKSTLASTIAKLGKTLFIDLTGEKGVRSFMGAEYGKNIVVARPTSITKMDDIFWELNKGNHDFKAVVIDSLTGFQKMTMRFLLKHDETAVREIKQGTAPADIRTWGQALDVMTDTSTFWHGLADGNRRNPMHVVMTAQTKVLEDEVLGTKTRMPDVQKGALSVTLAVPDYILYTDLEDNMESISDDSLPPQNHIVRFGNNADYRTKARVPVDLRGKIPSVLGRGKNPPDLAALSKVLRIGGVPTSAPAAS